MKNYPALFLILLLAACTPSEDSSVESVPSDYSPYVGGFTPEPLPANYDRPLWGDTHLHSSYSTDAGMVGNELGPDMAYRFARGEEVVSSSGVKARLIRPLDWLVVSDHAENLGLAPMIAESNPLVTENEWGKIVHDLVKGGNRHEAFQKWIGDAVTPGIDPIQSKEMNQTVWDREIAFADEYNEPGKFTALIGFEWTSIATNEMPGNLHRVVIFRDGAEKARTVIPMSAFDSIDPEDLWSYMADYEQNTGGSILAIAHNGNVSNGLMFSGETRLNGQPIDKNYVETRAKYEPLYEVTQIKGDGEAHPFLSPNDEFADYGNWDKSDIVGLRPKEDWMLQYEYAREALKIGMQLEDKFGTNPYKFGMIGSTDAHTSLASTREENFFGKVSYLEPAADRWDHVIIGSLAGDSLLSSYSYESIGAGLAAVWSKENTREAIFDAMVRKETYATTGTRIVVRVFAGWDYSESDLTDPDMVALGYDKGVPMGGDLTDAPSGGSPRFLVKALKDPDGANLDRVQIIKGWVDENGERQERIYDLAVSDDRVIGDNGRCTTPVGNTVDIANATYENTIGAGSLQAFWTDPEFNPEDRAFYYVRVLEIPTPTWQAYDAKYFGVEMPDFVMMEGQERAYTSPIWYTPR